MTNDHSMVERVATALHENSDSPNSWGDASDSRKDYCRDQARAAITAMREPTEAMEIAHCRALVGKEIQIMAAMLSAKPHEVARVKMRLRHTAAISAALQDPDR